MNAFKLCSHNFRVCSALRPTVGRQQRINLSTDAQKLFTPGPLNTTLSVKQAQVKDLGSRDTHFIDVLRQVHESLLDLADLTHRDNYVSVLMQGSGTFGVESVIQTVTGKRAADSHFLVLENGAYGKRMANMCNRLDVRCHTASFAEERAVDLASVERLLTESASSKTPYTHVGVIHSETSTGVLNPVEAIGALVRKRLPSATYIVDSMSAFGALPLSVERAGIDYLISSSNKCIQSVPGFSFVVCVKRRLLECAGQSRSLALDLHDQYVAMRDSGQFRFTPPVQALLAFRQALAELTAEGGPARRYARYVENHAAMRDGMLALGFRELVPLAEQSRTITTFFYPTHPRFVFADFYKRLSDRGQVIYPGKTTSAACFRIGNIGDLHRSDMVKLVGLVKEVLDQMGVPTPVS